MPKVSYPYEVNGKLVTENGSLIPICFLSNRSFLPSLTVVIAMGSFSSCMAYSHGGAEGGSTPVLIFW